MVATVDIAGRKIGPNQNCFVIAEAGVNHNGDIETARHLIDAAVAAGADAVKFQSFIADELVTPQAPKANYQLETTSDDESQYEMLKRLELTREEHRELRSYAEAKSILFLSSPFDQGGVDLLSDLGVPALKFGSGEITNIPLLEYGARKGLPMLVSTGMSTLDEVGAAVAAIRGAGNSQIILLHCVSNYPAEAADSNLRAIVTMREEFGLPIGYSDHTLGSETVLAAVSLGAALIEKHFTLDRAQPGPDHQASSEPRELSELIRGIRVVEAALGDGEKRPSPSEAPIAAVARKSLVAATDIPADVEICEEMIAVKRPGTGLAPSLRTQLVGRRTQVAISAGSLLNLEMFA